MSSSNIQSDESQTESFITDRSHISSFERTASEPGNQGSELQLLDNMHNGLLTNSFQQRSENHSVRTLKIRKRFGPDEDLLLVKEVNWILPFRQRRTQSYEGLAGNRETPKQVVFLQHGVGQYQVLSQQVQYAADEASEDYEGIRYKRLRRAVVRESAMQRLREQHLADAKRTAYTEENSELLPTDTVTPPISKETPTRLKHAILASLVPLMESHVEQAQGIQAVLREDMVLRRQQYEEMLEMRKRGREEENQERRDHRNQEFKFRQAQMEAESRRIRLMISVLSQQTS
ncbi:unnamed protein product [Phytophthora fragariaefolia]|uniref:Unnamed protein product n=1 Tax=Phytophthora fragariaefolia TaxID=1490495 RepID=A0A9W6Y7R4_9STRA|nr:unnamed protein product [Phytophthora fragariaefolia]